MDTSPSKSKALVLLSGGQDSTTCLYWAKKHFDLVEAVSFDYKQRHRIEIVKASQIAHKANVKWKLLYAPIMEGTSPLVNKGEIVKHYKDVESLDKDMEPTFVPARNIIFLTMAANYAVARDIYYIVTGVCQVDYGGYPDCRQGFIQAMNKALNLGLFGDNNRYTDSGGKQRLVLYTPLMYLSKKETVLLAKDLGCIKALADTHTCYEGKTPPCGKCHSCLLRAKGFEEAGILDPLMKGQA